MKRDCYCDNHMLVENQHSTIQNFAANMDKENCIHCLWFRKVVYHSSHQTVVKVVQLEVVVARVVEDMAVRCKVESRKVDLECKTLREEIV